MWRKPAFYPDSVCRGALNRDQLVGEPDRCFIGRCLRLQYQCLSEAFGSEKTAICIDDDSFTLRFPAGNIADAMSDGGPAVEENEVTPAVVNDKGDAYVVRCLRTGVGDGGCQLTAGQPAILMGSGLK